MEYIVNVYVKHNRLFLWKYKPKKRKSRSGYFYKISMDSKKKWNSLQKKLSRKKIRFRAYEKKYARNSNYRVIFFRNNQGPYRCRYCNCRLQPEEVLVDHVIPVGKASTNKKAQKMLKRRQIDNVNSLDNLVASCKECNENKGNQLGEWVFRGYMGFWKWKGYQLCKKALEIVVIAIIVIVIYNIKIL